MNTYKSQAPLEGPAETIAELATSSGDPARGGSWLTGGVSTDDGAGVDAGGAEGGGAGVDAGGAEGGRAGVDGGGAEGAGAEPSPGLESCGESASESSSYSSGSASGLATCMGQASKVQAKSPMMSMVLNGCWFRVLNATIVCVYHLYTL